MQSGQDPKAIETEEEKKKKQAAAAAAPSPTVAQPPVAKNEDDDEDDEKAARAKRAADDKRYEPYYTPAQRAHIAPTDVQEVFRQWQDFMWPMIKGWIAWAIGLLFKGLGLLIQLIVAVKDKVVSVFSHNRGHQTPTANTTTPAATPPSAATRPVPPRPPAAAPAPVAPKTAATPVTTPPTADEQSSEPGPTPRP